MLETVESKKVKIYKKILLYGAGGIGIATFRHAYGLKHFSADTRMTIGAGFLSKSFELNDLTITFIFVQLAGQDRFKCFVGDFTKGASCGLIGFDLTRPMTLYNLEERVNLCRTYNHELPLLLVGFKLDLIDDICVTDDYAVSFKEEFNLFDYIKISNKTGKNIVEVVHHLFNKALKNEKLTQIQRKQWDIILDQEKDDFSGVYSKKPRSYDKSKKDIPKPIKGESTTQINLTDAFMLQANAYELYSKKEYGSAITKWTSAVSKYTLALKQTTSLEHQEDIKKALKTIKENICNSYFKDGILHLSLAKTLYEQEKYNQAEPILNYIKRAFNNAIDLIESAGLTIEYDSYIPTLKEIDMKLSQIEMEKSIFNADTLLEQAKALEWKNLSQSIKLTVDAIDMYFKLVKEFELQESKNEVLINKTKEKIRNTSHYQSILTEKLNPCGCSACPRY